MDDGIVLETDPIIVAGRVSKAPAQDAPSMKNIDLSELGVFLMLGISRNKRLPKLQEIICEAISYVVGSRREADLRRNQILHYLAHASLLLSWP